MKPGDPLTGVLGRLSRIGRGSSITARVVLAAVVVGVVIAGVFVGLLLAVSASHRASAAQASAARDVQLGTATEQAVLNMETGLRGFLLTRQERFLAPWRDGQAAFPATFAALKRSDPGKSSSERAVLPDIQREVSSYIYSYADPLIRRARGGRVTPSELASLTAEGKRRLDSLRNHFSRLALLDTSDVQAQLADANAAAGRARWFGVAGLTGSLLLIALFATYLARAVSTPIRRIGTAARSIAEGDLSSRVPDTGLAELSELAHSFNTMGASLEDDVSRREGIELALLESQDFLDSIIEHVPVMLFVKDASTLQFVRFNRAGEQLLGYSRDELIGKSDHDLFPREEADHFTRLDREVLSRGQLLDIPDETIQTKDGSEVHLHTRKIPIAAPDGSPRYLVGVSEDTTEQHHAAQALLAAKTEAERANLAKSEFLSRMSHELRTPLNAILGFGQLLEMDRLDRPQEESVRQILHGGRHLLALIDEILDISRIEAGRMTLSVEPVELLSAISEILALTAPLASDRDIDVVRDFPPADQTYVLADRQRLRQVLLNLVSNAVKYNRQGGTVSLSFGPAPSGRVRIAIADTGPGIPAEKAKLLFKPFERLGAEHGSTQGTGLGLTLCKGLIEQMGGSIWLDTNAHPGSTFIIELEQAASPVDTHALDAARAAWSNGLSIGRQSVLYIEDNLTNFALIQQIFAEQPEVRLIAAMQGSLGLELARQHEPDLILLDLHLPDMPGRAVLELLKADAATTAIPVIILSADATRGQIEHLLDAGAAGYLTKPLDILKFLTLIKQTLSAGSVS
jgi:PAS domain S-box-containing protein